MQDGTEDVEELTRHRMTACIGNIWSVLISCNIISGRGGGHFVFSFAEIEYYPCDHPGLKPGSGNHDKPITKDNHEGLKQET